MKTVLIADDSIFMRIKISQILISHNFYVLAEAKNGKEAIEYYTYCKPDIVLLDLIMPLVDGLTALSEILKINPDAKVIVFSSLGTKYNIEQAIKLGAKDFIIKPHFEKLLSVIKNIY